MPTQDWDHETPTGREGLQCPAFVHFIQMGASPSGDGVRGQVGPSAVGTGTVRGGEGVRNVTWRYLLVAEAGAGWQPSRKGW